jgi:hypothetical protein
MSAALVSEMRSATAAGPGRPDARPKRPGPIGRGAETPPQALVLGMHRSGTSALTNLLDRQGFYAGPDECLLAADEFNTKGYWELGELHAFNEELLEALGGSWTDVLRVDPGRLSDSARDSFLLRARALVSHLNSYGPWVIKDPRLCLLLPFWRELLERPLCFLIYRDPLSVARSLARRDGLPILVGIALWEHYNRAALAASEGLPRVLVGYREMVHDPAAAASKLGRTLATHGVEGLPEVSPNDARALLDSLLDHHHTVAPNEELGYLNAPQRELLHALKSGTALLHPVPPLSAGAREVLQEHARQTREMAAHQTFLNTQSALVQSAGESEREARFMEYLDALLATHNTAMTASEHRLASLERERGDLAAELYRKQQAVASLKHRLTGSQRESINLAAELHRKHKAVAEREALLAAVFSSRSWRLGFGLTRLLQKLWSRRVPTAPERWQELRDG